MEMEGSEILGLPLANKHGEEESIEGYLKAWDAIKDLEFGPSHVNLASEIANRFMNGGHFANMVHFVNGLDEAQFEKLKDNETFERALISLKMTQRKYQDVFELLETGYFQNKEGLLEIWDKAHYREHEDRMGKPLNALLRYRIRQRFLPPEHICPNGARPTTRLPEKALKVLKKWLLEHTKNPYPSKQDKDVMMQDSGLSSSQVRTWFANARRRLRLKKEKRRKFRFRNGTSSDLDGFSDSQDDLTSGDHMSGDDVSGMDNTSQKPLLSLTGFDLTKISYNDEVMVPFSEGSVDMEPLLEDNERKGIVKKEALSNVETSIHPSSESSPVPLFKVPFTSSSSLQNCHHATQTSQFLKAMAGMCENISPVTYQLGAPRVAIPKFNLYQPVPEYLTCQAPRSTYQLSAPEGGYRYHPSQFQPSVYPYIDGRYGEEFPKAEMFKQDLVNQERLVPSGSISVPHGSISTSSGSISMPHGSISMPHGSISVPHGSSSVQLSHGSIQLPHGSIQMPQGSSSAPHGSIQLPHGSIQMPQGSSSAPHGSIQRPHGSIQMPQGSSSAPPALGISHLPRRPENGLILPRVSQPCQPNPWPAYQTPYRTECYLCYSSVGQCSVCKPVASLMSRDSASSHLPPFAMLMTGMHAEIPKVLETSLPVAMATENRCRPEEMYRHCTSPSVASTGNTLPSFTASFNVRGTDSFQSHGQDCGQTTLTPSSRITTTSSNFWQPFNKQTHEMMSSRKRRRHSCPPRPADCCPRPSESSGHPRRPSSQEFPKVSDEAVQNPDVASASGGWPGTMFRCSNQQPFYVSGGQARATHVTALSDTPLPPQAHSNHGNYQEAQSATMEVRDDALDQWKSLTVLDGRSQPLFLAEDSRISFSPQTGEGIKEIAQVLLDLSTKGSKAEQMIR